MKKIYFYIAGVALMALSAACSEEQFDTNGEGTLSLRTSVNTDMTVVSRGEVAAELQENCMVWISNEKGLVRRYNKKSEIPATIDLVAGSYVAEAWTGDSVSASFDKRWFKGREEFTITSGSNTAVSLVCKIANVGVSVKYAEGLSEYLSDVTMTVSHSRGELIFDDDNKDKRGYFMMPSKDTDLKYKIRGMQINGVVFEYEGTIKNVQPATEYVLNVKFTAPSTSSGGAFFTIEIDDKVITSEEKVQIVSAPTITGYGFDIKNPILCEKGKVGRRTIYVTSASKLETIKVSGDALNLPSSFGGNSFNIIGMDEQGQAVVNAKGINYSYDYNSVKDETIAQIDFESAFTDALENGDYPIIIEATDVNGRVTSADLHITIDSAPVRTGAADNISYFSATLNGVVSKDNLTSVGFKYRVKDQGEWISVNVSGSYSAGDYYKYDLAKLKEGTEYEFRSISSDAESSFESTYIETFSTLSAQLPNSSFEDWAKDGKSMILAPDKESKFWDSGNYGATTLGESWNITTSSEQYKHSGKYSARLESKYIVMKFAAGNMFVGKYLKTDGTDGVLGWGRPFTLRPKSMKVWVKYEPKTVDCGGDKIANETTDQGAIYIALVDDTKQDYDNESWPVIIKTKKKEQQLFDKDGANVIGYGEKIFESATEGDNMVQIEIPINYKSDATPANIILVASASRYGDYFQGANGSVMYVDDIELVYE